MHKGHDQIGVASVLLPFFTTFHICAEGRGRERKGFLSALVFDPQESAVNFGRNLQARRCWRHGLKVNVTPTLLSCPLSCENLMPTSTVNAGTCQSHLQLQMSNFWATSFYFSRIRAEICSKECDDKILKADASVYVRKLSKKSRRKIARLQLQSARTHQTPC